MKRADKVRHLVDIAADLFNRHGYHAAGIDKIIEESGIAKTTLYRHFKSKEDLIVAVLKRLDEQYRQNMREWVEKSGGKPEDKLLATFDYLEHWFSDANFYGCPFTSAAGEYCDRTSPVFQESLLHKRLVLAYFEELTRAAGLADSKEIVDEINLLHEGATAVAHITGDTEVARRAKQTAAILIGRNGRGA